MKIKLSNKDLLLKPHNVTSRFWWYEESSGITLFLQTIDERVIIEKISWRAIRNALKRKDRKG